MTEKEVIDFCCDQIAVCKASHYVEFIDALPRNPAGRVLKRELKIRDREPKKVS